MKRTIADLLIVLVLSLGGSICLVAQNPSVDGFLDKVSAHPIGDEAEQDQSTEVYESLNTAAPAEVERVLPAVLRYARSGNEVHARLYATLFLSAIAMRPDGADLLSASSEEISSLILDSNPGIQHGALAAMDYVIGKPGTNNQPYLSALQTAIQNTQTPQDTDVEMIMPLLVLDRSDPGALRSVLGFIQRDDLTRSTRVDLLHRLGVAPGLPAEVDQSLTKELDDPDPWVRATAVTTFADSTTEYHALAQNRVEVMANDPQENAQVRALAKEAMAGKTHLSPSMDLLHPPEPQH